MVDELDAYEIDYPDTYEPDPFDECEAFGGVGCKYFGCPEWGGDGLCFAQMRAGYGYV